MNAMLLSTTHIEQNKKVEWISIAICHYRTIYLLARNALLNNVENEYNNEVSTKSETRAYNEYLIKKYNGTDTTWFCFLYNIWQ